MTVNTFTTTSNGVTEQQKDLMVKKHNEILNDFRGLGLDESQAMVTLRFDDGDCVIIKSIWAGPEWQQKKMKEVMDEYYKEIGAN